MRKSQRGIGVLELIYVLVAGGVALAAVDPAVPANAPECSLEQVKAKDGNYSFDRQKPGACKRTTSPGDA